jgi:hypothetical protein
MLENQSAHLPANSSDNLLDQLSRNSIPYTDPLARIRWETLDNDQAWLPDEAISLYGTKEFAAMNKTQKRALARYEFLSFIEAGLWLENLFMQRIIASLRNPRNEMSSMIYHLHELREEAGHSLMFLELIRRGGPLLPNNHLHRPNFVNLIARFSPFKSSVFWTAVLIGEEVPDRLNRFIRKHRDEICPAIYDISTIHVMDEARHIAHARDYLQQKFMHMSSHQKQLLQPVLQKMIQHFVKTFYFPSAQVYELAGLAPGRKWEELARNNPERIFFVANCVENSMRLLKEHGFRLKWLP